MLSFLVFWLRAVVTQISTKWNWRTGHRSNSRSPVDYLANRFDGIRESTFWVKMSLSLSFKKGETKHVPTNVDLDFLPTITRAPSLLRLDYFRSQRRRRTMTPKELTDYRRRRRCDTVISNTLGPVPDLDDVIWIYFSLIKKRKKIAEAAIRTRWNCACATHQKERKGKSLRGGKKSWWTGPSTVFAPYGLCSDAGAKLFSTSDGEYWGKIAQFQPIVLVVQLRS